MPFRPARPARAPLPLAALALTALAACGDPAPTAPVAAPLEARQTESATVGTPLVDRNSGRCLDVLGESREPGTGLIIYDCHGRANQQFTSPAAGETGEIRVYAGEGAALCVDAWAEGTENGTRLVVWPCHGGANQQWTRTAEGEFRGLASGRCVDVLGARPENLTDVWLWDCLDAPNQKWDPTGAGPDPDAVHTLYAKQSTPQGDGVAGLPELIVFRSDRPDVILRRTRVVRGPGTPVDYSESWDLRPGDGLLYGIGAFSRVLTLDPATGVEFQSGGPDPFTPPLSVVGASVQGVGVTFEPGGALRVVSARGTEHLRVDPDGGTAAPLPPLAYAPGDPNAGRAPAVSGIAYAPSAGGTPPVLYAVDAAQQVLARVVDPDAGVLETVGPLGLPREVVGETDFDIAADGTAYVAFNVYDTGLRARSTTLYRVDLATGAATRLGPLGNGRVSIFGLAVAPD